MVELSPDEARLMREALLAFRNKADKSDEIILKSCCFTKSQSAKRFRPALPKNPVFMLPSPRKHILLPVGAVQIQGDENGHDFRKGHGQPDAGGDADDPGKD